MAATLPPEPPDPDTEPGPAGGQAPAMQAAFLKLKQGFVAGLPQRWAEIEAAPTSADRLQALHRLAGAAGIYGCSALSAAARASEQAAGPEVPQALQALKAQIQQQLQRQQLQQPVHQQVQPSLTPPCCTPGDTLP